MKILVTVEVGTEYLKIAVSRRVGVTLRLVDCIVEPIVSLNDLDISKSIVNVLKKRQYKSRVVSICLSRNFVTMRSLLLPPSDSEEIEKMTGFHITRIVPHKREDVVFTYCESGFDDVGHCRVTLAIAHKDVIRRQLKILDKAGFLIDGITLSSHCVWQNLVKKMQGAVNQKDLYIAIDVDADFSDFIIFQRDCLLFSRSITIKASDISSELGMKKLLGEMRQSLLVFQNEQINKKPGKIFLSGAIDPALVKNFEKELEMNVEYVPLLDIERGKKGRFKPNPPDDQQSEGRRTSLTAVFSLAVMLEKDRKLSFILPEMKIRKELREKTKNLVVCAGALAYVISLVCFIFWGRIYNRQVYLNNLMEESSIIEHDVGNLIYQVDKVDFVRDYLQSRKIPLFVFWQLQQIMSESIALNSFRIVNDGMISIRGQVFQLSDVFNFVNNLEEAPFFNNVQTKYTRQGRWRGRDVTDFEITFMVNFNQKRGQGKVQDSTDGTQDVKSEEEGKESK